MNPQLTAGFARGLVLAVAVAAATGGEAVCAQLLTGDSTKTAIITGIGLFCNTLLSRLVEGGIDGKRAAQGKLIKSDVGYQLLAAGMVPESAPRGPSH